MKFMVNVVKPDAPRALDLDEARGFVSGVAKRRVEAGWSDERREVRALGRDAGGFRCEVTLTDTDKQPFQYIAYIVSTDRFYANPVALDEEGGVARLQGVRGLLPAPEVGRWRGTPPRVYSGLAAGTSGGVDPMPAPLPGKLPKDYEKLPVPQPQASNVRKRDPKMLAIVDPGSASAAAASTASPSARCPTA
jgi:hypothetical protein